jgi:hypothetical protein
MASVKKIAELTGKAAGKAKLAAGKAATGAGKTAGKAADKVKSMKKQDIAASVRNATSKTRAEKKIEKSMPLSTDKVKSKPFAGLTGDKSGKGLKVAAGATGVAAAGSVGYNAMKGGGDREARETGTPNVEKKTTSSPKPSSSASSSSSASASSAPGRTMGTTAKGKTGSSRPATGQGKGKTSVYRAKAGDGLWQVAEKTKPAGTSTAAWWAKLKKVNSTNGKVNRVYRNSAIKLPPGAQPKDKGFEFPSSNKTSSKSTRNEE